MKKQNIGLGIAAGLLGYYGLSLASALWVARLTPSDYTWALIISAVVSAALGLLVAKLQGTALIASATMLVLVVLGFAMGSSTFTWIPPLPADFRSLFFHGARSPLVIGATAFLGATSIPRVTVAKRQQTSQDH